MSMKCPKQLQRLGRFISQTQDVRAAKNTPLLTERGDLVFDLRR